MFDTSNTFNRLSLKAPASGIIQKSHEKSFFVRMHQNSSLSGEIFSDKAKYKNDTVIVLQVLLTHENYLLVEMVSSNNF